MGLACFTGVKIVAGHTTDEDTAGAVGTLVERRHLPVRPLAVAQSDLSCRMPQFGCSLRSGHTAISMTCQALSIRFIRSAFPWRRFGGTMNAMAESAPASLFGGESSGVFHVGSFSEIVRSGQCAEFVLMA